VLSLPSHPWLLPKRTRTQSTLSIVRRCSKSVPAKLAELLSYV
jgi:hypothetical protein